MKNLSLKDVMDGIHDWVRVIGKDNKVIYANKSMINGLGFNPYDKKCYEALGKTSPCENCISKKAVFKGSSFKKEETIGNKTFSVMSSPVRNNLGEIIAVVEVLRDVTNLKKLQEQIQKQNDDLKKELSMANKLQCSMLPKKTLINEKINFSYAYIPCKTLGGDFFDIFKIDERHIGVYIADVAGHGLPASMHTVFIKSALDRENLSPSSALNDLYDDFNNIGIYQDIYITVFYAVINTEKYEITFSNAGHSVTPILFSDDSYEMLWSPGIPISNWMKESNYSDKTVKIKKGARLFLYTDGMFQIQNPSKEYFDIENLINILLKSNKDVETTISEVIHSIQKFSGNKKTDRFVDDVTVALVKIN